mgnify:CR=1 FL=1
MKKIIIAVALFSFFNSNVFGYEKPNDPKEILSYQEKQKIINWNLAKIQNIDEIEVELNSEKSPLYLLSKYGRSEFLNSIVFRENGLGGLNMAPLEDELTPGQIYQVLSLFGAQNIIHRFKRARIESSLDLLLLTQPKHEESLESGPLGLPGENSEDYKGYECSARATCASKLRHICMSSC